MFMNLGRFGVRAAVLPGRGFAALGVQETASDIADSEFPPFVRYCRRKKLTTAAATTDNYQYRL